MRHLGVILFTFSVVCAVLGFGGLLGDSSGVAQLLFFVLLIFLVLNIVFQTVRNSEY